MRLVRLRFRRGRKLDGWGTARDAAESAIRDRVPLTAEEREQGWIEDPLGSGLRVNVTTGEWDDSLFISHPSWLRSARRNARDASRRFGERDSSRAIESGGTSGGAEDGTV
jgi:hypothetical protein